MFVTALALLAATAAPATPARPPTEVSAVTVYPPTPPPNLVASYPAAGGAVAPGVVVLKLTFDQKMLQTGFDLSAVEGAEPPPCLKTPRLLDDGQTFVLLCTLRAGKAYALALNARPAAEARNFGFANVYERRATPTSLAFTTTRDDPIRNLDAAMKLQGLTALEVPVQEDPITAQRTDAVQP
ncbi:hypothetical protein [uncultured Phenylobacterium sp.]|uniref:hypothetical protein n=1 Tax=uncultured Phenylobacterium sp. TaxID=349273 RepID=UPI0025E43728|nr:hypothetical protein [uncultured Phenylobacterium sp.]